MGPSDANAHFADEPERNLAKLHSELKYFGNIPFMNESLLLRFFFFFFFSSSSSFKTLNTCMVPLSLQQHTYFESTSKHRDLMIARSTPRRSSLNFCPLDVSKIRINVPLEDAVASLVPSKFKDMASRSVSCAGMNVERR